ncbi:MAG: 50S ribosomal protein L25 [Phycisphaeraceae bacterium]
MTTATNPKIHAEPRDRIGSRYAARIRAQGKLPAVIYGHKQDPVHISVDRKEIIDLLHHNAHLIEVEVGGKTEQCLVKDVQWDHLSKNIIHVDLARVSLTEEVEVEVEIRLVGEPAALKEAGTILEQPATSIEVRCRANAIPEFIEQDISHMQIGDSLLVSDLQLPPGVTAISEPETLVAHLSVSKGEEEIEELAEGEDEPEVIGKAEEKEKEEDKE